MEEEKQEILGVLIADLKRVDEFEELDFGLRETWINSKEITFLLTLIGRLIKVILK